MRNSISPFTVARTPRARTLLIVSPDLQGATTPVVSCRPRARAVGAFASAIFALALILAALTSASGQSPVITSQPLSTNVLLGYLAEFSVTATSATGYQWRKEAIPIPGATSSALTLPSVKYTDAGNYSVLVSNANGIVASGNASLTVTPPAAGELDFSFNPGSGVNDRVDSVVVQPDGKVLIGGNFTNVNGTNRNRIARLNADGSLDTSFQNAMSGANGGVISVAVQPDGKVLIGGFFTTVNGINRNRIARLNADGSLDTSFQNAMSGANGGVISVAVQPDGKVLIGGSFTTVNGTARNRIARLNADGSLDTSFQNVTSGANDFVFFVAVQADGKALIGGDFTTVNGTARNRIARLHADGSLDTSFNPGSGASFRVVSIAVQPDGKVLIGGLFTSVNGTYLTRIARLNADGSLDTTFQNGMNGANEEVDSVAVQPDGKVLIGGWFTAVNGTDRNRIARLNADGSLDSSFNPGSGANAWVVSVAVQPDGKVLIGGYFTAVNGISRNRIARLYGTADIYDLADTDGDGLPSVWERQMGLDPEVPNRRMGTGADGPLSVEHGEIYTNDVWARVLANNPAGTNTLNVSTTNGFALNDLVLAITMQDPNTNLNQNTAGTYEFGRIAALSQTASATNLVWTGPRQNAFSAAAGEKIQVLKVPEYTEVTLTNSALSFDGVDDYLKVPDGVYFNGDFTIEAWVYPRAYSAWARVLDFGNGGMAVSNSVLLTFCTGSGEMKPHVRVGGTTVTAPGALRANEWVHLAATVSGTNCVIYTNGVLATNGIVSAPRNVIRTNNLIAASSWPEPHANVVLDEIRIWSTARSQEVIKSEMNRSVAGTEPGLVAYWRFNEGAGAVAHDATTNYFDGILNGAPTWLRPTLTCPPWNGTNGGVLAFLAHSVTIGLNGVISADGKGFRGGPDYAQAGADGYPGESFVAGASWPLPRTITNNFGGGGGGGRTQVYYGNGGGGGGYGAGGANGMITSGNPATQTGQMPARGGAAYGVTSLSRLLMGSGGGSGGQDGNNPGDGDANGGVGGAGGGIVICFASRITNSGRISASGQDGSSQVANERGPGGGGAGGSLWLAANSVSADGAVQAVGGAEGTAIYVYQGDNPGAGGPGALGRIRLDLPASGPAPANVSPAPGYRAQLSASDPATLLLWGGYLDSDLDGSDDREEFMLYTFEDCDGDGVANAVELKRGTAPDLADSDGDGLTDYQELFFYHTDPLRGDTDSDGISDGAEVAAGTDPLESGAPTGNRFYYDPLDRLVGVDYTNGLSLLYAYDGNDNLVQQAYLARDADANANGVPDAWEQLHGLTNDIFADTDGDGMPDGQEYWAGTDPGNATSVPLDPLGPAGSNITAGIVFPFIPSNCVVAVGQLDGIGAEEIVVSADGDPGTTTNFLLILSQTVSGWSTQRVDVGPFGVTSLAVGQPANRERPAIYVGLRKPGGPSGEWEFMFADGQWRSNCIQSTTNNVGFVLGVRPGRDVLISHKGTIQPRGTPYYIHFDPTGNEWKWTRADNDNPSSQRGLGLVTQPGLHGIASRGVRLLDAGGLQVLGDEGFVPASAIYNADYSRWFFLTPSDMVWEAAQSYAESLGGNLATVNDATLNTWLWNQWPPKADRWIGLRMQSLSPNSLPWVWASGIPVTYTNWDTAHNEPDYLDTQFVVFINDANGKWYNYEQTNQYRGNVEVTGLAGPTVMTTEPSAFSRLQWRGHSLCAGDLRLTNAVSILCAFLDDVNLNNQPDADDRFVVAEYLFGGTNVFASDIQRVPLTGTALAPSYGLACVEVLFGNQQALFTAEPDGRIFSWSATNATAPLQRQLFSAHDVGMAWHALAGVRTLEPGQCLLGLRVDPATPSRCDVILWPPVSQLSAPPDYPQTAPITQILPEPSAGTNLARVDLRLWDAEANPARLTLQYQRPYETAWRPATIDLAGYLATYPTGITHTATWNAALDLGPGFANTVQLRARAQDISLAGDWSGAVPYQVQTVVGNNPQAYPDTAITAMNQPVDIDVLANDTVENSAPKLIFNVGSPAHGLAATNPNQTIRYTPAPGFIGPDQFIYTLTDGAGAFSMATVTVTVAAEGPVVIQSPSIQAGNQFSMLITGPAGAYQVQTSTNLTDWSNAGWVTNTTGTVSYGETVPTGIATRFYRAVRVP